MAALLHNTNQLFTFHKGHTRSPTLPLAAHSARSQSVEYPKRVDAWCAILGAGLFLFGFNLLLFQTGYAPKTDTSPLIAAIISIGAVSAGTASYRYLKIVRGMSSRKQSVWFTFHPSDPQWLEPWSSSNLSLAAIRIGIRPIVILTLLYILLALLPVAFLIGIVAR